MQAGVTLREQSRRSAGSCVPVGDEDEDEDDVAVA